MKTETKPKLSVKSAVAILTENGSNPLHKDELFSRLVGMLGVVPPSAFKNPDGMGLKRHGKGRFSARVPDLEMVKQRLKVIAAEAPPADVLNGNPASGQNGAEGAHGEAGDGLTCPTCGKKAKTPAGLKIHIGAAHDGTRKARKGARGQKLAMIEAETVDPVFSAGNSALEMIGVVQDFADLLSAWRLVKNKRAAR